MGGPLIPGVQIKEETSLCIHFILIGNFVKYCNLLF